MAQSVTPTDEAADQSGGSAASSSPADPLSHIRDSCPKLRRAIIGVRDALHAWHRATPVVKSDSGRSFALDMAAVLNGVVQDIDSMAALLTGDGVPLSALGTVRRYAEVSSTGLAHRVTKAIAGAFEVFRGAHRKHLNRIQNLCFAWEMAAQDAEGDWACGPAKLVLEMMRSGQKVLRQHVKLPINHPLHIIAESPSELSLFLKPISSPPVAQAIQ